ncbi:hypothetical protein HRbin08_02250 [bacterium HR08]|nr:hypothetical protein HRbin08_02250 [bacterium HR08]
MRLLDLDAHPRHAIAASNADLLHAHAHRAPLALIAIEAPIVGMDLLFVHVGRIWSSRRHRDGAVGAVPEGGKRCAENGDAGGGELARVDSELIEAEFAVPPQMRINDGDRSAHRRALGRDEHGVGAALLAFELAPEPSPQAPQLRREAPRRIRHDPHATQIGQSFAHRPVEEDEPPQSDDVPRLNLRRPSRYLLRMFPHVRLHAFDEGLDHGARLRAEAMIILPAHLGVSPEALHVILREEFGTEHFGHRSRGAAIVLEQLLEPILRLRIADGVSRCLQVRGKDVRDAELVSIDGGRRRPDAAGALRDHGAAYKQNETDPEEGTSLPSRARHTVNIPPVARPCAGRKRPGACPSPARS